jgi:hypothetical protein
MIPPTSIQEGLTTCGAKRMRNQANLFPADIAKALLILIQDDLFTKAAAWRIKPV